MKLSKILILSGFLNLFLIGFYLTNSKKQALCSETQISCPIKKIALLIPAVHPAMDSIEQGLRLALEQSKKAQYEITTLNGNGNRQLMHAQIMHVLDSDADLIFTVGGGLASLAQKASVKKQSSKPIICSAVTDPIKLGLVQSLEQPGKNVTCIIENPAIEKQVALLVAIKTPIKQVLLVYDTTQGAGLEGEKNQLSTALQARNITLKTVEVSNPGEVYPKTAAMITGCDVVIIFKDHTTVSAVDGLIKLCTQHRVTLMTSDLDSGIKGAALSFGVEEEMFGQCGAAVARQILENGIAVGTIACREPGSHYLQINQASCKQQGLEIEAQKMLLLGTTKVVKGPA